MPLSRFDYEAMQAIARHLEQQSRDLEAYLEQVEHAARDVSARCQSPFAEALRARHEAWARAGRELAQSLNALGADLTRIVEAQRAAEEREGARFAHLPE